MSVAITNARDRVADVRHTLEHTSEIGTVPYIPTALEAVVKALEDLEKRIARLEAKPN